MIKSKEVNVLTGVVIETAFTPEEEAEWDAREAQAAIEAAKAKTPTSVTMRQARLALLSVNLLDDVEAAVAAAGRAAQIEWEYATEVRRDHPLIAQVQQAQGLTDAQIDQLFIDASTR